MSFQERFKGRTTVMDKSGIVGIISQKGQSIDKAQILSTLNTEDSLSTLQKNISEPPRFQQNNNTNNNYKSYKNDNQNYLAFKGQQNINNNNYSSQQQNPFLNTYDLGRLNNNNNINNHNYNNGNYQTSNQSFNRSQIPQNQQAQYHTFNMEEYQLVAIPKFALKSLDSSPMLRHSNNILQPYQSQDYNNNNFTTNNGQNNNYYNQILAQSQIVDVKGRKHSERTNFMNNAQNIIVSNNKGKQNNNNNYSYNLDQLADKHKEIIDKLDSVKKGHKNGKQQNFKQ